MLKWSSESEYFLSFEIFFADTIYISEQSLNPFAAHARRGVISAYPMGAGGPILRLHSTFDMAVGCSTSR